MIKQPYVAPIKVFCLCSEVVSHLTHPAGVISWMSWPLFPLPNVPLLHIAHVQLAAHQLFRNISLTNLGLKHVLLFCLSAHLVMTCTVYLFMKALQSFLCLPFPSRVII